MAIADSHGLPVAVCIGSASPHETKFVGSTLESRFVKETPKNLIGDRAYDSDPLDRTIQEKYDTNLIAPHRTNRIKPSTQDGRQLRRYRRRWKIERLFAWLQNFRRLVVRYEVHAENFLAFVRLGCTLILLRHF